MGSPQGSKACLAWDMVDELPMVDMLIDMDHGGIRWELLSAELSSDLSSTQVISQIQEPYLCKNGYVETICAVQVDLKAYMNSTCLHNDK
jgi:hypothetical protein